MFAPPPPPSPDFTRWNHWEAAFWTAIAVGCVARSLQFQGAVRRDLCIAAAAFLAFGLSDWVEAQTGAWWHPWWLLLWKGACLLILAALLWRRRQRRQNA